MSSLQKLGLVAATAAVAAAGFVVLRPEGEETSNPAAQRPTPPPSGGQDAGQGAPGRERPAPAAPGASPGRAPEPEIRLRQGRPVGGAARITVRKGEVARFSVFSSVPAEIHLHGYDVTRRATAGRPARFTVRAEIEGVFEVEAHAGSHATIAELVVSPP